MANDDSDPAIGVNFTEKSLTTELKETFAPVKQLLVIDDDPFRKYRGKSSLERVKLGLFTVFPILEWLSTYKLSYLPGDIVGGLTIASLAVPQSLGYAGLANLPPQYGLYTDIIPPVVYAIFGSSRTIAVGPTAVISLLTGSQLTRYISGDSDGPDYQSYLVLAHTATFYAGVIQLAMGVLRLGFVVDFLSHAVVTGFTSGAAVTIALQQLKGLLGYTKFTNSTDIVAVLSFVFNNTYLFNWRAFIIGIAFMVFLFVLRALNLWFKKDKKLAIYFFYLNALGPLLTVIISTACVYATNANQSPANVPTVKKMPKGFTGMATISQLQLSGQMGIDAISAGVIIALIAITEAVAIARTFAAYKGYHIDGNKEMVAFGAANILGSFTSAYTSTGSFSRSAVNYTAGANTMLSNIILALATTIVVAAISQVFQYFPQSALASIIIVAVIGLVDYNGAISTWKADKVDFIALMATFFGVIFLTVEIGLLIGVAISLLKVLVQVTRPSLTQLGSIQGTFVWRSLKQYANAKTEEGILVLRVDAPLYFPNAPYLRERIFTLAERYEEDHGVPLTHFVLDFTPVPDIDTTGIMALNESRQHLEKHGVQLALSNPSRPVLRKLAASGFVNALGAEWFFLSAHESVKSIKSLRSIEGLDEKDVEAGQPGEANGEKEHLTKRNGGIVQFE